MLVEESCEYRARGVSIWVKFILSRNLGYKTKGIAMWLIAVLTPDSLPRSQSSGTGHSVLWVLLPPLPNGGRYSGNIRSIEPHGGTWAQETCVGCPQQRYATGEPGKLQGRGHVGIEKGPVGTGSAGTVFGDNSFYRETWDTKTRESLKLALWLNVVLTPGSQPRSQSKKISNYRELIQSDPISCPQTKREITKYINWREFTKGTRSKPN